MRLLDVELNFGSSEEQGDSDSEEGADDDGDGSLVDLLETRLRQDGVDLEEARGIAEQVVQIRTQRDEWESVRANIEAADAAYDEILSEFAERKRKIVESGVDSSRWPGADAGRPDLPANTVSQRLTSRPVQAGRGTRWPCSSSTFCTGHTTRSRAMSGTSTLPS